MNNNSWKKQLEKYRDEAYEYYSRIGICPTAEEILDDVCSAVEDESGCDVDEGTAKNISDILGLQIY